MTALPINVNELLRGQRFHTPLKRKHTGIQPKHTRIPVCFQLSQRNCKC